jgi:hypothetical protein
MTSVIARVPLVNLDDVEPAMAPLLERTKAASGGRLLNLHRQMANAPAVLAGYMGLRDALSIHATVDGRTHAAISIASSAVDHGEYTLAISTRLAVREGWSERQIATISEGCSTGETKLDALLSLVREATSTDGRVADGTWSAAQAAGWSDGELAETFAYIGLVMYVDRFVRYAATELDVVATVQTTAS